jgi:hypothetical protein
VTNDDVSLNLRVADGMERFDLNLGGSSFKQKVIDAQFDTMRN